MRVRQVLAKDEAALRKIHEFRGHGDTFPDLTGYLVVVDDQDKPLMAAGIKMVPEVTLICSSGSHPLVKLKGIALLHDALRDRLSSGNHTEAFSFVAPAARAFGRHLVKHFGWRETWKAFAIRIERP